MISIEPKLDTLQGGLPQSWIEVTTQLMTKIYTCQKLYYLFFEFSIYYYEYFLKVVSSFTDCVKHVKVTADRKGDNFLTRDRPETMTCNNNVDWYEN